MRSAPQNVHAQQVIIGVPVENVAYQNNRQPVGGVLEEVKNDAQFEP